MEQTTFKQFLGLLLAVLLISTSGVLGRYIALPTEIIIWFRSFLAVIFLFIFDLIFSKYYAYFYFYKTSYTGLKLNKSKQKLCMKN